MRDEQKARPQLLAELAVLRQQVADLEEAKSECQRVQDVLRESEEKYRAVFESAQVGLVRTRLEDGLVLDANPHAARMFGYSSREEFVGHCCVSAHYVDPGARERALEELREKGVQESHEVQFRRTDGSVFWAVIFAKMHPDKGYLDGVIADITERREAGEALRRSEERYRRITQAVTDYVYTVRLEDGHPVETLHGPACVGVTGYAAEEFAADPFLWFRMVHEEDRAAVQEQIAGLLSGEFAVPVEHRIVRKDGEVRWVRNTPVFRRDAQGNAGSYDGLIQDITERRQVQQALRESEEKYRLLVENANEAIVVAQHGRLVFSNRKATELTGYSELELASRPFVEFIHPADREMVTQRHLRRLRGEQLPQTYDFRIVDKEGQTKWVSISAVRITWQGRAATLNFLTDITERKRAERLLHALNQAALAMERAPTHEAMFYAVAEELKKVGLSSALFLMDESQSKLLPKYLGYDARAIKAAEKLMGIRTGDFSIAIDATEEFRKLGRHKEPIFVEDVGGFICQLLPRFARRLAKPLARMLNAPRAIWAPLLHEDRVIGALTVQSADLTSEDVPAITAFAHQMSAAWHKANLMQDLQDSLEELKQTQAQLVQAQKMEAIGQLAGGIAHDFNNLLTVINGYSQFIVERLDRGDPLREDALEVHKAGEQASELTRQLLAFSRRQMLDVRVLDLNDVLTGMGNMLGGVIGENIRLEMNLASDLGSVKADPGQIEQVVTNLAVNARDAMPEGGVLTLETANVVLDERHVAKHAEIKPGPYVSLAIGDTGCGMTPEVMQHLFEPFFTTKEAGKGTGLGLATVYGIVKQSGGDVHVHSEPGEGSIFRILLPCVDRPSEEVCTPSREAELPEGTETILVVEDQDAVRQFTARLLRRLGYTVLEAGSGPQALSLLEDDPDAVDLVFTDLVMPEMSGRELVDRVLMVREDVKVLYTSGYTDGSIVQHGALDTGMSFIEKPFATAKLASKLRGILDET